MQAVGNRACFPVKLLRFVIDVCHSSNEVCPSVGSERDRLERFRRGCDSYIVHRDDQHMILVVAECKAQSSFVLVGVDFYGRIDCVVVRRLAQHH